MLVDLDETAPQGFDDGRSGPHDEHGTPAVAPVAASGESSDAPAPQADASSIDALEAELGAIEAELHALDHVQ